MKKINILNTILNIIIKFFLLSQAVVLFWILTSVDIYRELAVVLFAIVTMLLYYGTILCSFIAVFWDTRTTLGAQIFYIANGGMLAYALVLLFGTKGYHYHSAVMWLQILVVLNILLSFTAYLSQKYLSKKSANKTEGLVSIILVLIFACFTWNYKINRVYSLAMNLDSSESYTINEKAKFLYKFGAKKKSFDCWSRTAHIDSASSSSLARLYEQENDFVQALVLHKKAITNETQNAYSFVDLAELLLKLQYPQKARRYFTQRRRAIDTDKLNIAATYLLENNYIKALEYVKDYEDQGYSRDRAKELYDELLNIGTESLIKEKIDKLVKIAVWDYEPISLDKHNKKKVNEIIDKLEL